MIKKVLFLFTVISAVAVQAELVTTLQRTMTCYNSIIDKIETDLLFDKDIALLPGRKTGFYLVTPKNIYFCAFPQPPAGEEWPHTAHMTTYKIKIDPPLPGVDFIYLDYNLEDGVLSTPTTETAEMEKRPAEAKGYSPTKCTARHDDLAKKLFNKLIVHYLKKVCAANKSEDGRLEAEIVQSCLKVRELRNLPILVSGCKNEKTSEQTGGGGKNSAVTQ